MSTAHCEEIGPELVAFLDGELDETVRRPVATHVASCLVCRREVERLTVVRRWVGELPGIAPSPSLADGLWERIAADPAARPSNVRPIRPWQRVAPVLAAAAVIALAFASYLTRPAAPPVTGRAPEQIVAAPPPAPAAPNAAAPVVVAKPAPKEAPQVASADAVRPEDLQPEDLPPELLEHPELFLRLPVVRRLETLEHFDAVRDSHSDEGGAG